MFAWYQAIHNHAHFPRMKDKSTTKFDISLFITITLTNGDNHKTIVSIAFHIINILSWSQQSSVYESWKPLHAALSMLRPTQEHYQTITIPEHMSSLSVFNAVRVTRALVLYVCFVDHCLSFFFWSLCCLFFFDLRILIATLVSSNSSLVKQSLFNTREKFNIRQDVLMLQLTYNFVLLHTMLKVINNIL